MEMMPNRKKIDQPQKRQGRLLKLLKVTPGASHKMSTGLKAKRYYTYRLTIKKALIGTGPFGGVRKPY